MGTGSFLAVIRLGHGVNHPPPSNAKVKERAELYFYSPLWLHCRLQGEIYLLLLNTLARKFLLLGKLCHK